MLVSVLAALLPNSKFHILGEIDHVGIPIKVRSLFKRE